MKATLWGTRGSVAAAGPSTVEFGGDTSCVEVRGPTGEAIILDAGSGIRPIGAAMQDAERVDIVLSHLHMDHIQGLGFFGPLFDPSIETHIWGPASTTMSLTDRLARYLSPPLFPVRLRELPSTEVHDLHPGEFQIGSVALTAAFVCHPGTTFGYRLETSEGSLAYLPDHEPALGSRAFPEPAEWTSGSDLIDGVDVLIHDAQYTEAEYADRVGWGHSTLAHATTTAARAGVGTLVTFHHDPAHSDRMLTELHEAVRQRDHAFTLIPGRAGETIEVSA